MRLALNITRKLLPAMLLFLALGLRQDLHAQIIFDGINCNNEVSANGTSDEWGTPMATDYDGVTPSSADIEEFWAVIQDNYLMVAMKRRGKGNSGFALHINTDCDSTNNNAAYNGSDFAFFFSIQSGVIQDSTMWIWDTITDDYISSGQYFSPILGGSSCSDSLDEYFFEFRVPLSTVFDVCGGICETLSVAQANVHSGGSFSSTIKDELILDMDLFVNQSPVANINVPSIVCANELVSYLGTNSTYNSGTSSSHDSILVYEWDMSYDGTTFNAEQNGEQYDTLYTTSGSHTVALKVEDLFGCASEIDTMTLEVFSRPQLIYDIINGSVCEEMHCYAGGSIDNAGADNLDFFWDLGDGATSTSDSFTYTYDSCQFHTVFIKVTDPDNPAVCASDSVVISSTLPVELLSYEVKAENNQAVIQWVTSQEVNASHFIVERSTDGIHYQELQTVSAQGNSQNVTQYQAIDVLTNQSTVYYKLTQVDFDGASLEYGVRVLTQSVKPSMDVYPNPVNKGQEVLVQSANRIETVQVFDLSGRQVLASQGASINTSSLVPGIYHVQAIDIKGKIQTKKLVVN